MKIWHISDTHGHHSMLSVPEVDMVIHSGDATNYFDKFKNHPEFHDFITWFGNLNIKHKVLIAGNHDAHMYHNRKQVKEICDHYNITYLENESAEIEGIKVWGSPVTPQFGNWYFMRKRESLNKLWQTIPEDTDIVVVHGPPKGILDISENRLRDIEFCGCSALKKRMMTIQPKLVLFGHIHNYKDITNAGTMKLSNQDTIFSNGSVVTDREFGKITSNGNILEI